jgi:hypothetical protein
VQLHYSGRTSGTDGNQAIQKHIQGDTMIHNQIKPDGIIESISRDVYERLRGEIGQYGDFALEVPVIVVETATLREFWTTDGQRIGHTSPPKR